MSVLSVQAQRLSEDGLSHREIEAHLVSEGNSPEHVRDVVASLSDWIDDTRHAQARATDLSPRPNQGVTVARGLFDLVFGLGLVVLGTGGSLVGAKIFIGAIVVGLYRVGRGVVRLAGA